ncbi:2-dehydropantoate 2-reductase [Nakamurella panacisegetis]|uniref:2-dehydropantoate 2-reductase n=1 Tax=Nakamurella panacisegetis TaxID=1090615 RepID=A0A1H0K9I2_9ACTN|nr:ketopantoate reductase family protein [Nakamurella panacisegetis]SDO52566.1 2-dehydropantoate 2-reductase [Nakamurella panacisegetis]
MTSLRILVVGAGATGGYFGGRLAQAGRNVTFLVRPGRAEQLRREGLQIVSEHGNATLNPQIVSAPELSTTYDLVLLSVKAYGLEAAMSDFAPAVSPTTLIVPMLNGIRHIDLLTGRFGWAAVLGGVCVVSATLDPAGRVMQLAGMQELTYGPLDPTAPPTGLPLVDAALSGAGFEAKRTDAILPAMWQKWIMLSSVGAMNSLMRGTVGEIVAAPGGVEFADALLAETSAVASAAGYPLRDAGREYIRHLMTTPGSTFTTSMYRDLLDGRPVEVDAIVGDLVERGRQLGVPTPLMGLALTNLSVHQARASAAG